MRLGGVDLVILAVYLGGMVAFGLRMGRRGRRSLDDYLVAGRDLPWWLVLASLVATETSTVTFLSVPAFAYSRNLTWLQLALGMAIGRFVVAAVLLPGYFEGRFLTAYALLEQRFGRATKAAAAGLFVATRCLADGLRLFLSAIVLEELADVPLEWAVPILAGATLTYTFFGGMRAVVWTDLVQLVVYLGGAVLALAVLVDRVPGGVPAIVQVAGEAGRLRVVDLRLTLSDPWVLWAGLAGGIFLSLGSHGADQLMVQRYLCTGRAAAARAVRASGVVVFLQFAFFLAIGVALYAFYAQDPVGFDRADRVFARFIVEELPVGVRGVVLGAVFAAAMSTLSSSLNSCAAAAVQDIWAPLRRQPPSEQARLALARRLTLVFAALQAAVGLAGPHVDATVVASVLAIAGFTSGIVLGLFFLGMRRPAVPQVAALAGLVFGLVAMTTVYLATSLAWPWYALAGCALTYGAGCLAALAVRQRA